MSRFPRPRQRSPRPRRPSPSCWGRPRPAPPWDEVTDVLGSAAEGRTWADTGPAGGGDGSVGRHGCPMRPPFRISSGLTRRRPASRARSASLPTATDPPWARPWAMAGLYFATAAGAEVVAARLLAGERAPLLLHLVRGLPGADHHFADAPMACESEDIMPIAPGRARPRPRWSARMRDSAKARSSGILGFR